jgi:hypothetical protein
MVLLLQLLQLLSCQPGAIAICQGQLLTPDSPAWHTILHINTVSTPIVSY